MGKEIICSEYGENMLDVITNTLQFLELGKVPDLIKDEQLLNWYCPKFVETHARERAKCLTKCQK